MIQFSHFVKLFLYYIIAMKNKNLINLGIVISVIFVAFIFNALIFKLGFGFHRFQPGYKIEALSWTETFDCKISEIIKGTIILASGVIFVYFYFVKKLLK